MTEEADSAEETTEVLTGVHERCIKQSVPIAARNVKFLSNQLKTDRFFAEIVSERKETAENKFNIDSL